MKPLTRYILLQVPEVALVVAIGYWLTVTDVISAWVAWVAGVLWIAKDAALYPFVRKAYSSEPSRYVGREQLEGAVVRVDARLDPEGWVLLRGERWKARASRGALGPGDRARVLSVRDLTLVLGPRLDDPSDRS